jgi:hypothetical protein
MDMNMNCSIFYLDNLLNIDLSILMNIIKIFNNLKIVLIFVIFFTLISILFANKSEKIVKGIGRIGTGVLAGVGAVDSTISLYDRIRGDSGGSNNSSNDDNKDNKEAENKKSDKNNDEKNKVNNDLFH